MAEAKQTDLFTQASGPSFLVGSVVTTIFTSPDSYYKVLLVAIDDKNFEWSKDEITVVGNFGEMDDDKTYRFDGKLTEHARYGWQFAADTYHVNRPTSRDGIIAYLSGKDFPGVGKKTAEKIVDALGNDAIAKIQKDPNVLDQVKLSKKVVQSITENLAGSAGMDNVIIGLNDYGFGTNLTSAIVERYGDSALSIIDANPFQLVTDIDGISFRRADAVATKQGMAPDDPRRIDAALLQTVNDLTMAGGDTYTETGPVVNSALDLLANGHAGSVSADSVEQELLDLTKSGKLTSDHGKLYPSFLYRAEWQIAENLHRLMKNKPDELSAEEASKLVKQAGQENEIEYDDVQQDAIKAALSNRVLLITGGPGTGKTTIIKGIVRSFAALHDLSLDINSYHDTTFPIRLAAPTGRAAKRMSEVTGLPASTIHRLLGLNGREMPSEMEAADIEGSLLIVDEMSMVDTLLFRTLIASVPNNMQVVLVGDQDQLPSVGPGQVFHDLLSFDGLPKVKLEKIYRQAAQSSIIPLAHAVREGKVPDDLTAHTKDRSFIRCNAYQVTDVISQIVLRSTQKDFTATDVQILAPIYRGAAGIDKLNELTQQIYNPASVDKEQVVFRNQTFRVGDKVLQLVNSPENNVFNGDIGTIEAIETGKGPKERKSGKIAKGATMTINFGGNQVIYSRQEWSQIKLAYTISIHKSQGSQFTMVILPMVHQYGRMLRRNLLYTALTRASKLLILVGEPSAFADCIHNEDENRRTTLNERLSAVWDNRDQPQLQPIEVKETKPVKPKVKSQKSESTKVDTTFAGAGAVQARTTPGMDATNNHSQQESIWDAEQGNLDNNVSDGSELLGDESEKDNQESADDQSNDETSQEEQPLLNGGRLTNQLALSGRIDPNIGMQGLTPRDFMSDHSAKRAWRTRKSLR